MRDRCRPKRRVAASFAAQLLRVDSPTVAGAHLYHGGIGVDEVVVNAANQRDPSTWLGLGLGLGSGLGLEFDPSLDTGLNVAGQSPRTGSRPAARARPHRRKWLPAARSNQANDDAFTLPLASVGRCGDCSPATAGMYAAPPILRTPPVSAAVDCRPGEGEGEGETEAEAEAEGEG